jgi:C-terminal processing protease CtpA/Prc
VGLQQYPQFSQRDNLYVLIGGRTFSSAVYLASLIREQTEATFIGEPTAQGPNFYASPRRLILPHSGLEVQYPLVYWQSSEQQASAIEPDIWVKLSSGDYFAGRDPVLGSALAAP